MRTTSIVAAILSGWMFGIATCVLYDIHVESKYDLQAPTEALQPVSKYKAQPYQGELKSSPVGLQDVVEACKGDVECHTLAATIVYEARGEGELGKYLVANTVVNRVNDKRWGNSVYDVVYQHKQFSFTLDKHIQSTPSKGDWNSGYRIAYDVLYGSGHEDIESVFYHTTAIMPYWSEGLTVTHKEGSHIFYK